MNFKETLSYWFQNQIAWNVCHGFSLYIYLDRTEHCESSVLRKNQEHDITSSRTRIRICSRQHEPSRNKADQHLPGIPKYFDSIYIWNILYKFHLRVFPKCTWIRQVCILKHSWKLQVNVIFCLRKCLNASWIFQVTRSNSACARIGTLVENPHGFSLYFFSSHLAAITT